MQGTGLQSAKTSEKNQAAERKGRGSLKNTKDIRSDVFCAAGVRDHGEGSIAKEKKRGKESEEEAT